MWSGMINPLRRAVGLEDLGQRMAFLVPRDFRGSASASEQKPQQTEVKTRIILALDATLNRQSTWDLVCSVQPELYNLAEEQGSLGLQLVYYSGMNECRASSWINSPEKMTDLMTEVTCAGGITQVVRVLKHAASVASNKKVSGLIFIGDQMQEDFSELVRAASELAQHHVPVFVLFEGDDAAAKQAFLEVARLTRGACIPFDHAVPRLLAGLLSAATIYFAQGEAHLRTLKGTSAGIDRFITYLNLR